MADKRSTDEIRDSIHAETEALSTAVAQLRHEVSELTDWRKQARDHREQLVAGAAIVAALGAALVLLKRFLGS